METYTVYKNECKMVLGRKRYLALYPDSYLHAALKTFFSIELVFRAVYDTVDWKGDLEIRSVCVVT